MKRMRIGLRWTSTAKNRFLLLVIIVVCVVRSMTSGQSIDRCDVSSVLVPDANVRGGQERTTGSNVTECEIVCSEMTSCLGFDWSKEGEIKCFLLTSGVESIINYNVTGVDHYSIIRDTNHCIGSCSYPRWVPTINTHGFGGEWLERASLTDCARYCTQDSSCFSFDWDPFNSDGKNCWIINTFSTETSPAVGVFHYDKKCSPISTTVVRSFSASVTTRPIADQQSTVTSLPTTTTSSLSSSSLSSSSSTSSTTTTTTTTTLPRTTPPKSSSSSSSLSSSSSITNSIVTSISTTTNNTSGLAGSTTFTGSPTSGVVPIATSNDAINSNSTTTTANKGPSEAQVLGQLDNEPMAIKSVYVVLAGLGGGCLLLVLTAVIILCEYPLTPEDDGLLKGGFIPYPGDSSASSNELVDMELFNPEFRTSGVIATEFEVASVN